MTLGRDASPHPEGTECGGKAVSCERDNSPSRSKQCSQGELHEEQVPAGNRQKSMKLLYVLELYRCPA